MPMNEEVRNILSSWETMTIDHEPDGWPAVRMRELTTIRAELTRLTEIADSVDPLIVRLGEVTTKLEALIAMRNRWEQDAREHLNTFGQHMPASLECLVEQFDAHLAQPAQAVDVRVVYELFQDGFCVAGSDDLSDALHYVSQYSQDGPVELRKVTCHSEIIDTAADGEG